MFLAQIVVLEAEDASIYFPRNLQILAPALMGLTEYQTEFCLSPS